jgi:hypothetical protein
MLIFRTKILIETGPGMKVFYYLKVSTKMILTKYLNGFIVKHVRVTNKIWADETNELHPIQIIKHPVEQNETMDEGIFATGPKSNTPIWIYTGTYAE